MNKTNLLLIQWILYSIALLASTGLYVYEISFWKPNNISISGANLTLIAVWGLFTGFYFSEWLRARKTQTSNLERSST